VGLGDNCADSNIRIRHSESPNTLCFSKRSTEITPSNRVFGTRIALPMRGVRQVLDDLKRWRIVVADVKGVVTGAGRLFDGGDDGDAIPSDTPSAGLRN
jgi:hypothetical protein